MKKIVLFYLIIVSLFWNLAYWVECTYNANWSLASSMENCVPTWAMEAKQSKKSWIPGINVSNNKWYAIDNAKDKVIYLTQKLIILAWILAVWWVAYSGLTFVLGLWDAEKVKKAKWALKWSLLWFVVAIISQQLINATINFIYNLSN